MQFDERKPTNARVHVVRILLCYIAMLASFLNSKTTKKKRTSCISFTHKLKLATAALHSLVNCFGLQAAKPLRIYRKQSSWEKKLTINLRSTIRRWRSSKFQATIWRELEVNVDSFAPSLSYSASLCDSKDILALLLYRNIWRIRMLSDDVDIVITNWLDYNATITKLPWKVSPK